MERMKTNDDMEGVEAHHISVELAMLWWDLHNKQRDLGSDDEAQIENIQDRKDQILQAYVAARRSIPKDENGERYGHKQAHYVMQHGEKMMP
jgi:hypothetical protein